MATGRIFKSLKDTSPSYLLLEPGACIPPSTKACMDTNEESSAKVFQTNALNLSRLRI